MPPKGSKRSAPKEVEAEVDETETETGSDSLRRSTRGGGHKAPDSKPAKQRTTSGKKSKTAASAEEGDGNDSAAPAAMENGKVESSAAVHPTEPTADGVAEGVPTEEKGVSVPEPNIEAAKTTESKSKSGKIEIGEILPEGLVLKNEEDQDVTIADLTREKGAVFFVYPKVSNSALLFLQTELQAG